MKEHAGDGGPAFPHVLELHVSELKDSNPKLRLSEGMSMRQYLAAHAPLVQVVDNDGDGADEPPYWYDHAPRPKWQGSSVEEEDRDRKRAEYDAQIKAWERDRFFAWRWYYADQMLLGRTEPDALNKDDILRRALAAIELHHVDPEQGKAALADVHKRLVEIAP